MKQITYFVPGLAAIRLNRQMTQAELATELGIARSTVAELETGVRPARLRTLRMLISKLGVTQDQLLTPTRIR